MLFLGAGRRVQRGPRFVDVTSIDRLPAAAVAMERDAAASPAAPPIGVIGGLDITPPVATERAHRRALDSLALGDREDALALRVDRFGLVAMRRGRSGAAAGDEHTLVVARAWRPGSVLSQGR